MIKFSIFLIISFTIATKSFSTNVAVIDVNYLINNSNHFIEISKKINNSQIIFKEKFNKKEESLYKIKEELEDLKLILSQEEFDLKKDEYYKKVAKFENDVSKFNTHYDKFKEIIHSYSWNYISHGTNKSATDTVRKIYYLISNKTKLSKIK